MVLKRDKNSQKKLKSELKHYKKEKEKLIKLLSYFDKFYLGSSENLELKIKRIEIRIQDLKKRLKQYNQKTKIDLFM